MRAGRPGIRLGVPYPVRLGLASLMKILRHLRNGERGQDLAEYGIALGIIAVFVAVIAIAVGSNVNTLWSNGQTSIGSVVSAESS